MPGRQAGCTQFASAPDALMIGAHFASSAWMNSATCFGVLPGVGSMPTSCSLTVRFTPTAPLD